MDEVFVAVMGPTGSGKSTFIQQVTGDRRCRIGKSLLSETQGIHEYRCQYRGRTYVLIDTPGFDDSYRSNDEIVETILQWLEKTYRARMLLSGIIYLHRISDARMQGSSLQNIRMFRRLCGLEALKNVILVTTFWDTVSAAEGQRREQQLSTNDDFWGRMIKKGSKVKRWSHHDRGEATEDILDTVIPSARRALQAQIEIVDQGKRWEETDVGRATLEAMRLEMVLRLQEETTRIKERRQSEQLIIRLQHEQERESLRQAATRQRQIEEDARVAADWAERDRIEMESSTAKLEIQRQIQEMQEEIRQAEETLVEGEARNQALAQFYETFPCHHSDADSGHKCDSCGVKLHKNQSHYFHCCHCSNEKHKWNYNQCSTCGMTCPMSEHPVMALKATVDSHNCVLM
ncbi:P-loop containing nucleoside triphosphate hydrolase protein [Phaeosphaeria sp. MPI-PUGE-AT-0046c]|nr:P-loop containing nucleoside triphosphate hydrolase protein [Phaeosphaeria sp. MPI-PUGE-AT-0046c]